SSSAFIRGRTFHTKTTRMMTNAMAPHSRSGSAGSSRDGSEASSAAATYTVGIRTPSIVASTLRGGERDERDGDRDEAERLGQRDAEEHEALQAALELGLAGDGLDRLADDDAHADTGADGGEAERERCELSNDVHWRVS